MAALAATPYSAGLLVGMAVDRPLRPDELAGAYGVLMHPDEAPLAALCVASRAGHALRGLDLVTCLFTDADAILEQDALKMAVRNFADPRIGCVEGVRRDRNEQGIMLDNLYWKYETMIKRLNSRLQAILGATGAIFAVRKDLYDPINAQRGDDFEIPVRVRVNGFGAVLEPKALAYHPWLSNKDEFARIVRIVAWMLPSALILLRESVGSKRWLLAFQLLVHKIMRWLVPFFMIALFAVNTQLTDGIFLIFLLGQVLFYLLAVAGFVSEKKNLKLPTLLKVPYFFCLINAASLVGVVKSVLGWGSMDWTKTARERQT